MCGGVKNWNFMANASNFGHELVKMVRHLNRSQNGQADGNIQKGRLFHDLCAISKSVTCVSPRKILVLEFSTVRGHILNCPNL